MNGYSPLFRRVVTATLILLIASGLLLLPTVLEFNLDWDVPWRLHEGRVPVAAIHAIAGFMAAAFFGALWRIHMTGNWRRRHSRISGMAMASLLVLLALTGIGIYYFGSETMSIASSLTHSALGLGVPLVFTYHFIASRRLKALDTRRFSAQRSAVAQPEQAHAIPPEALAAIERTTSDRLH